MPGKSAAALPTKPLNLIEAALKLREAGEMQRALGLFEEARQLAPEHALPCVLLAVTYQSLGDLSAAEIAFRQALALEPDNEAGLQGLGLLLLNKGQAAEGIGYLRKQLALQPADVTSLDALVTALLKAERAADAAEILRAAWEKSQDADIGVRYARLLLSLSELDQARRVLEQVVSQSPSARNLTELSLVLVVQEDYAEAIRHLQRAVELEPSFNRAWRGLAHCYTQTRQLKEALAAADRALEIDPQHYRNWQARADALLALDRSREALDAAQKGLDFIRPADAEARPVIPVLHLQKVNALLQMGDVEQALQQLETARRTLPDEERFYDYSAQLLLSLDRAEEAIHLIDEAFAAGISQDSQLAPLRYQALHRLGQAEAAWAFVEPQLRKRTASRLDQLASQGLALYSNGHYPAARAVFEQLARCAPDDARIRTDLGFMLIGEGRAEAAQEHLLAAAQTTDDLEYRWLALCNLGFLYISQQRLDDAESALREVLKSAEPDQEAILRVAFVKGGQVIPDYTAFPNRSVTLQAAAQANLVAVSLLRGQQEQATEVAEALREAAPQLGLSHEVLGLAHYARGDPPAAAESWRQSLELAAEDAERLMIEQWLAA